MKRISYFFVLGMLLFASALWGQTGSSCSNAITAVAGTNTADNSSGDQWFKYTVTHSNVNLKISTCGLTTADTYVKVYTGDCANLQFLQSSDDYCSRQSKVSLAADSGVTYYIVWKDDYTNLSYSWTLEEVVLQPGSDCQHAITAVAGTNTADNSSGEQWFKYTVTHSNVKLKISTCGLTSADTYVMVYKGDCGNLQYVAYADQTCGDQSRVTLAADSGVTYYIVWKDYYTNLSYSWTLEEEVLPPGSDCQHAITAVAGINHADSTDSQWFKYKATKTGKLVVTDFGMHGQLYVYNGNCNFGMNSIICNIENLQNKIIYSFYADSGVNYYLVWENYYRLDTFSWVISEQDPLAGEFCENPNPANRGINIFYPINNHQYFNYTASKRCKILVSSCGLTTNDNSVEVFKEDCYNYTAYNGGACNNHQSQVSFIADSGINYIINWMINPDSSSRWLLSELPIQDGDMCSNAIIANPGTNHTDNSTGDQWFKFTATKNGIVYVSSCGFTEDHTYLYICKGNCDWLDYITNGTNCSNGNQREAYFVADSGTTYFIRWVSYYSIGSFDWTLTELGELPGYNCEHAITANCGMNVADNSKFNQWFKFTATRNANMVISSCGLTNEDTYVKLYGGDCSSLDYISSSNDVCDRQSRINFNADSGKTYYILWRNLYTRGIFPWSLLEENVVPVNNGAIAGPTTVCTGEENVTYTVDPIYNASGYVWIFPDGGKDTTFTNSMTIDKVPANVTGGKLGVYGYNVYGKSDTAYIEVSVSQSPAKPVITRSGNILYSNAITGNQWYNLAGPIAGATGQNYTVSESGKYFVIVSNGQCSSEPSDTLDVIVDKIDIALGGQMIKVYPNPVSQYLIVESDNSTLMGYEIVNLAGSRVARGEFTRTARINVHSLANGVYILRLMNSSEVQHIRFIKK
jgi:hypothetical protein